ncbi:myosin-binding protein 7-like isoform X2 [Wolffia australiana]
MAASSSGDGGGACCSCRRRSPPPWQRSVKRKREEMEAAPPAEAAAARVEAAAEAAALREALAGHLQTVAALSAELDEERSAAASAADEAMSMILRLQREKAAALMESRQFKLLADQQMHHDQERIADLEEALALRDRTVRNLSDELDASRRKLLGLDAYPPLRCEDGPSGQRRSTQDLARRMEDLERDQVMEKAVVVVAYCCSNSGEFFAGDLPGEEIEGLYRRLEALEADRESMRRAIVSMSADKAQLVLLKEIAQNLYQEAFNPPPPPPRPRASSTRRSPLESSPLVSIAQWIMSFVIWKHKGQRNKRIMGTGRGCSGGLLQVLEKAPPWHHLHVRQHTCCFSPVNREPSPPDVINHVKKRKMLRL